MLIEPFIHRVNFLLKDKTSFESWKGQSEKQKWPLYLESVTKNLYISLAGVLGQDSPGHTIPTGCFFPRGNN